ncbi:FecR family protein [Rhizosphaericola mali]|uniref:DUF4974 domain-containing protein n=1 Tax=Rhizosphaericola mali TaxID=2545455 RepID=A0A5P2G2M4_9BACT|nr:hypothetical protein [Rhizosphaericola mali]QES88072.1 DUF4974 domain-containing protein [Rhizosphaericola mali]
MPWIEKRKEILFDKLLKRTITASELRELDLLGHLKDDDTILEHLDKWQNQSLSENDGLPKTSDIDIESLVGQIRQKKTYRKKIRVLLSCACMGLFVILLVLFSNYNFNEQQEPEVFIGKNCSILAPDRDLDQKYFACDIEMKNLFQKRLDNKFLGGVFRFNNLEFSQQPTGILKLSIRANVHFNFPQNSFVTISTPPKRQVIISLPSGLYIRLDGGSKLHYLINPKDSAVIYCRLEGQAYVKFPENNGGKMLALENYNSQILTYGGEFMVRSEYGYSKAVRLNGEVSLATLQEPKGKPLTQRKNMMEVYHINEAKNKIRDSFTYSSLETTTALNWTKTVRHYNNVSIRTFLLEMERWYGFTIESVSCLPKDRKISAAICQDATLEDVFAAVSKKGITIYQNNGMYTFCPPAGRLKKQINNVTYIRPILQIKMNDL